MQEYAAEHLRTPNRFVGSGEPALRQAQQRHGACFAAWAAERAAHDLAPDLANLIAACRRAADRADVKVAVPTLEGAWQVVRQHGPLAIGVELASAVRPLGVLDAAQRARTLLVLGSALDACGRVDEAARCLDEALNHARVAGDRTVECGVRVALGELHATMARVDDAWNSHVSALEIARSLGDAALQCAALNGLGTAYIDRGDTHGAREQYQEALQIARAAGDRRWECGLLGNLGGLCMNEGRLAEAETHLQQELLIARELGSRDWEGSALCNLGALHHMLGRLTESQQASTAALQITRALGHRRMESVVLCNLGLVGVERGEWSQAAEYYESALALARELEDRRSEGLYQGYIGQLRGRQGRIADARQHIANGLKLLEQVADRYSLGVVLCHRAEVEHGAGDVEAARAALAQARSIANELGAGAASELGGALVPRRGIDSGRLGPGLPVPEPGIQEALAGWRCGLGLVRDVDDVLEDGQAGALVFRPEARRVLGTALKGDEGARARVIDEADAVAKPEAVGLAGRLFLDAPVDELVPESRAESDQILSRDEQRDAA